jgi:hypothetical protein
MYIRDYIVGSAYVCLAWLSAIVKVYSSGDLYWWKQNGIPREHYRTTTGHIHIVTSTSCQERETSAHNYMW